MAISKIPTDFQAWIRETLTRFSLPTSPYYKYWNKITVVLAVVGGIAWVVTEADVLGGDEPRWVTVTIKLLTTFFAGMRAAGQFTVNAKAVAQTPEESKPELPFTEKKDIQSNQ